MANTPAAGAAPGATSGRQLGAAAVVATEVLCDESRATGRAAPRDSTAATTGSGALGVSAVSSVHSGRGTPGRTVTPVVSNDVAAPAPGDFLLDLRPIADSPSLAALWLGHRTCSAAP
ncbi:MAG: hypothetical protein WCF36_21240 [Candidatus Nanopelagicales bacterium]